MTARNTPAGVTPAAQAWQYGNPNVLVAHPSSPSFAFPGPAGDSKAALKGSGGSTTSGTGGTGGGGGATTGQLWPL